MSGLFVLKEYIETLTGYELYSGRGAETGTEFGVINYLPNLSYQQPYIHTDGATVKLYDSNLGDLIDNIEMLLIDLNQESLAGHDINNNTDNVRFIDIHVRTSDTGEYSLIGEREVFGATLDIVASYV